MSSEVTCCDPKHLNANVVRKHKHFKSFYEGIFSSRKNTHSFTGFYFSSNSNTFGSFPLEIQFENDAETMPEFQQRRFYCSLENGLSCQDLKH